VLSLQSQLPLTGEGATLTRRAVAFAHCSCARRALPVAGHNDSLLTRAALRCDHTPLAHAHGVVT
jgi:hypothetical protein